MPLIATLSAGSPSPAGAVRVFDAFLVRMKELGYENGRNMRVEQYYSEGDARRLVELASEIVRRHADVIIATSTPAAYAARLATSTLPIVMGGTLDAQHAGLVTTLSRPEGNVTGLTAISLELVAKRMQVLREVLPRLSRLGFLGRRNSRLGGGVAELERLGETLNTEIDRALDEAARPLGLSVEHIYVREPNEIRDAFVNLSRNRAEALYVLESPGLMIERKLIVDLAIRYRLPAVYSYPIYARTGGLVSYGPDTVALLHEVARYVDKILRGAQPGDLPVQQPTKFELVINQKTAKAIGITIPQSLLLRADEVIQ